MQHQDLHDGRWFTLTLAEQLGNVGSEFGRALLAQERGQNDRFEKAAERFYELMTLTLCDPRWQGSRRRELARVKELSGEALYDENEHMAASLDKYFMQFALLARSNK